MPRKVGWTDESISGGRGGRNRERQFRVSKGVAYVVRVMTECEEFRVHAVDDVLEPDKDGEPRAFNMGCSQEWDDDAKDWTGECLGCEREYDTRDQYICGLLVVGMYKGRAKVPQKIDPENSAHYWDFGPDKYRDLSDKALELSRADPPKKLHQVELVVKLDDVDGAEKYQKLKINVSQGKTLTTKAHIAEWKEVGEQIVAEACKPPNVSEQKRRLKKKRTRKARRDDDDSGEVEARPAKRRTSKPRDEEPEDQVDEVEDEDLDELLDEL